MRCSRFFKKWQKINLLFNECRKHSNESYFTFDVRYKNNLQIDNWFENFVKTFCWSFLRWFIATIADYAQCARRK